MTCREEWTPLTGLHRRRLLQCLLLGSITTVLGRPARADEVSVPVSRQAELLVRVAAYDRNLPARAAGTVRVLILTNPEDADSRGVAAQMEHGASQVRQDRRAPLRGHDDGVPGGGAARCDLQTEPHLHRLRHAGAHAKIPDLVAALGGVDVLSVAAVVRYVAQGVVLGFDLISAKPTLVINLPQANKQNVSIDAGVLNLMKVIQ